MNIFGVLEVLMHKDFGLNGFQKTKLVNFGFAVDFDDKLLLTVLMTRSQVAVRLSCFHQSICVHHKVLYFPSKG